MRLAWTNATSTAEEIRTHPSMIWIPTITLNTISGASSLIRPEMVTILQNGTVFFTTLTVYTSYCTIMSQYYPYDTHACFVYLKSYQPGVVFSEELQISSKISTYHSLWWLT